MFLIEWTQSKKWEKKSRRKQFLGEDGGGRVDEFHVVVVLNVSPKPVDEICL